MIKTLLTATLLLLSSSAYSNVIDLDWYSTEGNVTEWWLYLGTGKGAKDIRDSGPLGASTNYNDYIPYSIVWVRIWYRINYKWDSTDFTYTPGPDNKLYGWDSRTGIYMSITTRTE